MIAARKYSYRVNSSIANGHIEKSMLFLHYELAPQFGLVSLIIASTTTVKFTFQFPIGFIYFACCVHGIMC